jgi:hypothetical protein
MLRFIDSASRKPLPEAPDAYDLHRERSQRRRLPPHQEVVRPSIRRSFAVHAVSARHEVLASVHLERPHEGKSSFQHHHFQ